ncbi:MAG: anaerobic glycerol-3-phosphate dehydrogenase subunit C [Acidimicrobiia bacterium]|nr:anaerobic glycerol-3-phosphate dehydrogenase subunit C [Acidimicrobiia bacterium]
MIHQTPEETLDNCIKCNICVTECPVANVTELFPGPKYEGPQAARFRGGKQESPDHSVDYCSGCRVCNLVCPTGVKIAEINARARAVMVSEGEVGLRNRIRNNLIARPEMLNRMVRPVAPLANAILGFAPARWLAEKTIGIDRRAAMPTFANESFRKWFETRPRSPNPQRQRRVVYFAACSTESYEARVGRAAVAVMEANGFEVVLPKQNCCGLPLLSNGEFAAAEKYHRSNVDKLAKWAREGFDIVGTSTSCTLTLKEEAPELLGIHDEDSRLVAEATYDIDEYLQIFHQNGELAPPQRSIPLRLAYHPPCQYRGHRIGLPAAEMLQQIPDLEIAISDVACCGIAGTYGYKKEKYDIAMAVGEPLFDFVDEVGGPVAVCDSETCRWQITAGTGTDAVHPVELLAYSYGAEVSDPLASILP